MFFHFSFSLRRIRIEELRATKTAPNGIDNILSSPEAINQCDKRYDTYILVLV